MYKSDSDTIGETVGEESGGLDWQASRSSPAPANHGRWISDRHSRQVPPFRQPPLQNAHVVGLCGHAPRLPTAASQVPVSRNSPRVYRTVRAPTFAFSTTRPITGAAVLKTNVKKKFCVFFSRCNISHNPSAKAQNLLHQFHWNQRTYCNHWTAYLKQANLLQPAFPQRGS